MLSFMLRNMDINSLWKLNKEEMLIMKKKLAFALICLLLLSSVTALADYGAIMRKNTNAYANSKLSTPVGTIPKYAAVVVKSVKSGKAKVSFRGYTVYVKSNSLQRPFDDYTYKEVVVEGGNTEDTIRYVKKTCYVYDYPSTKAHKLKKVKKGTILSGFMEKGGWSIVLDRSNTYYGYVKTSNLLGLSGGDNSFYKLD